MVKFDHWRIVDLDPFEYEQAASVGMRRHIKNMGRGDSSQYDMNRMQDNRIASIDSAACELGVAKLLGVYWPASVWDVRDHDRFAQVADLPPNIEVRRVTQYDKPVVVRKKEADLGRILVSAYMNEGPEGAFVVVRGWAHTGFLWGSGEVPSWCKDGGSREVPVGELVPIDRLQQSLLSGREVAV